MNEDDLLNRSRAQTQPQPRNAGRTMLLGLAFEYDQAAGTAFAQHRDADAEKFREAAKKLRALAEELPAIPTATR